VTKKDELYIVNSLEQKAKELDLFIQSININKHCLNMQVDGKFTKLSEFLNYIQLHYRIGRFVLNKEDIDLSLDVRYFYNEVYTYNKLENLVNPFEKKRVITKTIVKKTPIKKKTKEIKISAIVLDEVCIDNKWYKKEQIVLNHKILAIYENTIEVQNMKTNKKNIIKLHSEI
jgi:hypothetical protein